MNRSYTASPLAVCIAVAGQSKIINYLWFSKHIMTLNPNITGQIKSWRMRWAGHVARMGEEKKVFIVLVGRP
jgi:hypothetical protein